MAEVAGVIGAGRPIDHDQVAVRVVGVEVARFAG
jgi:hypothetical protein